MLEIATINFTVGRLAIAAHDRRVCALWFGTKPQVRALVGRWFPGEKVSAGQGITLAARSPPWGRFSGDLRALDGVEVELHGTPFQQRHVAPVPTYRQAPQRHIAQIARAVGAPNAVRAVGAANGANPVSLIGPATASSGRTAASPVTAVGSIGSAGSWHMSRRPGR